MDARHFAGDGYEEGNIVKNYEKGAGIAMIVYLEPVGSTAKDNLDTR